MERNEQDIFDELVREKLTGYTEPPDPAWIKNIHAKKNRVINLYHLYRLMLLVALVGAGVFSSILFFTPQQDVTSDIAADGTSAVELNTAAGVQPTDNTEFVAVFNNTSFAAKASGTGNSSSSNTTNNTTSQTTSTKHTGNTFTSAPTGNTNAKTLNAARSANGKPASSAKANASAKQDKATANTATGNSKQQSTEKPNSTKQVSQPAQHSDSVSINTGKDTKDGNNSDGKEIAGACNASFEYYTSYTGEVTFTNTSLASSGAIMSWNFGDGDRSVFTDPNHMFPKSGTYEVTLYVKDSKLKCEDSYTKTITFRNPEDKNVPVAISGVLYAGGTTVKKGIVELFVFDEKEGMYVSAQTVKTSQSGEFSIPIQKGKRYLLRGNPTSTEENYISTFWGNTTEIENASDVVAMLSEDKDLIGYNIDLQTQAKSGDNEDQNPVNPIASNQQNVLLLDANNNIVSVATIDANGNYNFGDVAPGEYTVVNPTTGASSSKVVTGGSTTGGSTAGKVSGNVGGSASSDDKVTVFPNPANTVVNFGVNSNSGEQATIVIMNAGGVELSREVKTFVAGFNQTQYDLSAYPPGIYYVLVFKGNQQVLSNRIVKLAADPTK